VEHSETENKNERATKKGTYVEGESVEKSLKSSRLKNGVRKRSRTRQEKKTAGFQGENSLPRKKKLRTVGSDMRNGHRRKGKGFEKDTVERETEELPRNNCKKIS